jgi:hypothetical protein
MKLFITNKNDFESIFDSLDSTTYSTKVIHQDAYNKLFRSINIDNSIPLTLTPSYDEQGVAILDFQTKKDDIYYYTFNGTAK